MFTLAERMKVVSESITLAVCAKAAALKKQGVDVVGFGAGEPDFDTPAFIKEAAATALGQFRDSRVIPDLIMLLKDGVLREKASAALAAIGDAAIEPLIAFLYDPTNDGRPFRLRDGRTATLRVRRYANPLPRWALAARGKAWRSDELKTARLLFQLERHGIGAPRLRTALTRSAMHSRPTKYSPPWTTRMLSSSCIAPDSFSTNPRAPRRSAWRSSLSSTAAPVSPRMRGPKPMFSDALRWGNSA